MFHSLTKTALAIVVVLALALVGCGGGKPSDGTIRDLAGQAVIQDAVLGMRLFAWMHMPDDYFVVNKVNIRNVIKRGDNMYEAIVETHLKFNYAFADAPANGRRGLAMNFGQEYKKGDPVPKPIKVKLDLVKGDRGWKVDRIEGI